MSTYQYNSVAWFEVGTDQPEDAKRFYGELFDWSFSGADGGETQYYEATAPGADRPSGGVFDSKGRFPGYAVFYVVVEDVAATVAKAETLGGKVVLPPTTTPDGLVFAQLHDATGNRFGVFTPAP
jgi:predicted enzyme related to lactoylglutathione lyase